MVSLFVLRKKEPQLERPFVAPLYPVFPGIALGLSVIFLAAYAKRRRRGCSACSPALFGLGRPALLVRHAAEAVG